MFDLILNGTQYLRTKRKHRKPPPLPQTNWKAPTQFPRLSDARAIALDTETYDPELEDYGPGWARHKGHIVGVSIATEDHHKWYFPFGHISGVSENISREHVVAWLRDVMALPVPKIGANLYYDVGWLEWEGIKVKGDLYDVQFAEALLSENTPVNLEFLAQKYLGAHKQTDILYEWLAQQYGGNIGPKQRANIYKAPPSLVGPYAEDDAALPFEIMQAQAPLLHRYRLWELFRMECDLIPLLVGMRMQGVCIDVAKAEQVNATLKKQIKKQQKALDSYVGFPTNIYAATSLAKAFQQFDIPCNKTKLGHPSFTKNFLKHHTHPLAAKINKLREVTKLQSVFIEKFLLNSHVGGRIHCTYNSMRSDDFGTRSGRLSAAKPNLTQIPSRDPILAPLIRGLFIPEHGCLDWIKQDASQIEFRSFAHFAKGRNASKLRRQYAQDDETDYHKFTCELIKRETGIVLKRKPTKTINFGIIYGMGQDKLCRTLGVSKKKALKLLEAYHEAIPYARHTLRYYSDFAQRNGYVTTILGRRSLFEFYEPIDNDYTEVANRKPALLFDQALRQYGAEIKRAMTYKAFNRKLQGTAADIAKKGMLDCYQAGLFDEIGFPLLTVHDELNFQNPGGYDHIFAEIRSTCENAIKLKVPIIIEEERGPDWGHVKKAA